MFTHMYRGVFNEIGCKIGWKTIQAMKRKLGIDVEHSYKYTKIL